MKVERYLGDGVYASYDGYMVWLDLRAQPPTVPVTRIGLEPMVLRNLTDFAEQAPDELKGLERRTLADLEGGPE